MRAVPWFERAGFSCRRWLSLSFPVLLGLIPITAAVVFGGDWLNERQEAARALPPAGTPNVLLIVLDTVRADRMSLYGYAALDNARARSAARSGGLDSPRRGPPRRGRSLRTRPCSPVACPAISTCNGERPWRGDFPTLAEFLGSKGYATAGFRRE